MNWRPFQDFVYVRGHSPVKIRPILPKASEPSGSGEKPLSSDGGHPAVECVTDNRNPVKVKYTGVIRDHRVEALGGRHVHAQPDVIK